MSATVTTFLFELVNFLLLAALLGWLLFRPARQRLQARQAADRKRDTELAGRAAEVDRREADLDARLAAFDEQTSRSRADRLAAAEQEAERIVARARQAADRERARLGGLAAQAEREEIERLAGILAATARGAVAGLLQRIDGPELHASLVRGACRQLQALQGRALGPVVVESAIPLAEPDRQALVAAMPQASASTFTVQPALGAGVRVSTAAGLIDASTVGISEEAARELKSALEREASVASP